MNVVVSFLHTLVSDESNGSIRRMLGLCGEFERIAKVVLDKAEKDSHTKKKRKVPEQTQMPQNIPQNRPQPADAQQPATTSFSQPLSTDNPGANTSMPDPNMPTTSGLSGDLPSNIHSMPGLGQDFEDMLSPDHLGGLGFPDQSAFPGTVASPMSPFQQPFVPQDLWQMPMTIEWDWADMSNNFPVFGAGMGMNGPPQNQQ